MKTGEHDLKLLDCTLRDGGYVNDWKWGFQRARKIIQSLVMAQVDIVEVGFLRNVEGYDPDITVCNTIEELNRLLPEKAGRTVFSGMAMRSNYDIDKLSPYSGSGIEMIRVTAHDYDIAEGLDFAAQVKEKGYKVSINPINIMGYTDDQLLRILNRVNHISPYQFSVVDTFGSMKRRDLDRIISLVDHNLDRSIRVSLHLHENMSLSCCLAQNFVDKHLNRPTAIDGSLMGMGRIPGNLPIELIADYLNEYADTAYDIDYLMDAIQDDIAPLRGETQWGYTPAYFISARFNLHRNYAEYYLSKGDLTNRDMNHILARFDREKKATFDKDYAERMYEEYQNNRIDDRESRAALEQELADRRILLVAPGTTAATHLDRIRDFIRTENPVVIGINFIPQGLTPDYVFFSNNKRFARVAAFPCRVIVTSNLKEGAADYRIDYNSLSGAFRQGCNSFIMILKLLKQLGARKVWAAGADGYSPDAVNYYDPSIHSESVHGNQYNLEVMEAIRNLNFEFRYLTPSRYDPQGQAE